MANFHWRHIPWWQYRVCETAQEKAEVRK